jgi:CGNR zinc finger/Putative stress-induced transcription regulator
MTGENVEKGERQPGGRAPAPGELALLQSFINTKWDLADPRKDEIFTSPGRLEDWLRSRRLMEGPGGLAEDDLDRALAVREGLRALAFVNNDHPLDEAAVDSMRRASHGAASEIRIEPDGPLFVPAGAGGIDAAFGALFAITARAMIDDSWKRLKACPGRYCGWVFYDASRNQSARWCSMKVCGDREKSRAYYRRRVAPA